jgi:DNA-binding transcriptional MerR regulator
MAEKSVGEAEGVLDPRDLLGHVQLSAGKAAEFCGISRRQLCYWTDQGIIRTVGEKQTGQREEASRRVYDFESLHKAMLIKQALDQGIGLRRALKDVDAYLERRAQESVDLTKVGLDEREEFLQSQATQLEEIAQMLRARATTAKGKQELLQVAEALEPVAEVMIGAQDGLPDLRDRPEVVQQLAFAVEQLRVKVEKLPEAVG